MSENKITDVKQYDPPLDVLAHRLWTHWSKHIAEEENISEERIQRWEKLWVPFDDLPSGAKETDRRLVQRFCDEAPNYNTCE